MLILPDYSKPYLIDSLTAPIIVKYHWIFSGPQADFMLSPITYLEETTGEALKVRINDSEFWIPKSWNILVTDKDTAKVDTVPIKSCATVKHSIFAFSTNETRLRTLDAEIIDETPYDTRMSLVHPMITKGTMLVHPVGPAFIQNSKDTHLCVVIGPHDLYKYLSDLSIGDLITW
jgi:hypothetical protein